MLLLLSRIAVFCARQCAARPRGMRLANTCGDGRAAAVAARDAPAASCPTAPAVGRRAHGERAAPRSSSSSSSSSTSITTAAALPEASTTAPARTGRQRASDEKKAVVLARQRIVCAQGDLKLEYAHNTQRHSHTASQASVTHRHKCATDALPLVAHRSGHHPTASPIRRHRPELLNASRIPPARPQKTVAP